MERRLCRLNVCIGCECEESVLNRRSQLESRETAVPLLNSLRTCLTSDTTLSRPSHITFSSTNKLHATRNKHNR